MDEAIDIIILAAGESSRLGRPKQMLYYKGDTLLQYTIKVALQSKARRVYTILGAYSHLIELTIKDLPIQIIQNNEWQEGMSSSIRSGMIAISSSNPTPQAVIIMLCDQPFVTSILIDELIETYQSKDALIINCKYESSFGPPILFDHNLFSEMDKLEGADGAKPLVRKYFDKVKHVDFPDGDKDVDTEMDRLVYLRDGK
jgi:molybdenum cofactor cytidylyltransferase